MVFFKREPAEFPVPASPAEVSSARERIVGLIPMELKQAYADLMSQMGPGERPDSTSCEGLLKAAFFASNALAISSFARNLGREERSLLDRIPARTRLDPDMARTLKKAGVSLREQHHTAAVITLLEDVAGNLSPSLTQCSLNKTMPAD